jgi:ABC-type phosphate transport system substrate-binding protein
MFFYYQDYMAPDFRGNVQILAVDGVMPSSTTIADGSYPLVTKVYAVTRKDLDKDSNGARLLTWLLSDDGQKTIARSGYVPLTKKETNEE